MRLFSCIYLHAFIFMRLFSCVCYICCYICCCIRFYILVFRLVRVSVRFISVTDSLNTVVLVLLPDFPHFSGMTRIGILSEILREILREILPEVISEILPEVISEVLSAKGVFASNLRLKPSPDSDFAEFVRRTRTCMLWGLSGIHFYLVITDNNYINSGHSENQLSNLTFDGNTAFQ